MNHNLCEQSREIVARSEPSTQYKNRVGGGVRPSAWQWHPRELKMNFAQSILSDSKVKVQRRLKYYYGLHIKKDPVCVAHHNWANDNGDSALRLNYELNEKSVVLDLGGYKGDFAEAIHARYGCVVYLFEPVTRFYKLCQARFANNAKIKCLNFGLSDSGGEFLISDEDDGSSLVKNNTTQRAKSVLVLGFTEAMAELSIQNVGLLKVNIEGGEYSVLPHLVKSRFLQNIRYLQIQFHSFVPYAAEMRSQIRRDLSITHREQWNYPFIWESWERQLNTEPEVDPWADHGL
jgi:FkbM family methyltransferase